MQTEERKLVSRYLRRNFSVDFVSVSVTRQAQESITLRGAGSVSLVKGKLAFKIFVDSSRSDMAVADNYFLTGFHNQGTSGQLIKKETLFTFEATDFTGAVWRSDSILLNCHSNGTHCILHFTADALSRSNSHMPLRSDITHVWLPERVRIYQNPIKPHSVSKSASALPDKSRPTPPSFDDTGIRIAAQTSRLATRFDIECSDLHSAEHIAAALIQSNCFMSGAAIPWVVLHFSDHRSETLIFRSIPRKSRSRMQPPLSPQLAHLDSTDPFWTLFGKCFEMSMHASKDDWSELGRAAWRAAEDSEGSIDTSAIGLCTVVEYLCTSFFKGLAPAPQDLLNALDSLKPVVSKLPETERQRIDGALGQLRGERTQDVLKVLCDHGVVEDHEIQAWKKLRNSTAHARFITRPNLQMSWDQILCVNTLLHKLGFQILSYSGTYRDLGKHNWPQRDFAFNAIAPHWK
jgi:hypothetical protein